MSYRMKRLTALLGTAILITSLSACSVVGTSDSTDNAQNTENSDTQDIATSEDGKITVSQLDSSDMFSDRDKEIGYDDTESVHIDLSDSSISCESDQVEIKESIVTIKKEGTYTITSSGHGLEAKDSVRIANGDITITAQKDGIHCENSEETDKGFVYVAGGKVNISSEGDGIDSSNIVQIDGGNFNIISGGGSENAAAHTENMPGNGVFGGKRFGDGQQSENGQKPEKGQRPERGQKPEDAQTPDEVQTTEGVQTLSAEQTPEGVGEKTKGVKADAVIFLNGGSYNINSADDAFHSNGSVQISDGEYTIAAGDDAVHADEVLLVTGASIDITKCYEGLEGMTITLDGGDIKIVSSDDGLNAAGGNDSSGFGGGGADSFGRGGSAASEDCWIEINDCTLYVNASGDGIDSNGNLTINGGNITVDGPSNSGNAAIDFGEGAKAYINGGTLIAIGCSGMVENFDSSSKQSVMNVQVADSNISGEITLTDSKGKTIAAYTPAKEYNCVQISTSDLNVGEIYTLNAGNTTTTVELADVIYSNISGGFRK